ncbi:hypothetical protein [Alkalihalobacillus sp. LMS39]|uniref:hypothetical protein n=1 Tax=Alkalihalobacillus sp. LMS39 TaxID=2924032 RepID=UPI001FB1E48E|nr:hypothetical protein [Alkalihalobacillus sp. LMS39]UOE94426.1 hypothetical protein MM271_01760 [Alkalihalobacillus sp. LMS39]
METLVRKLITLLISIIVILLFTSWVVRGIYFIIFQSHSYITFVSPMLYLTKYFVLAVVLLYLFIKYVTLTRAGKIIIPIWLVLSIIMVTTTSLWFHGANEDHIMKHRIIFHQVKSWDEVEYVSTEIRQKQKSINERRKASSRNKVIPIYKIHFTDNSTLNIWSDISSIYKIHRFVVDSGIEVKYLHDPTSFDQKYSYYFKGSLSQAHEIFGIHKEE